jgi:DNA-binding transcriptional regulator GbsR (MarR family)
MDEKLHYVEEYGVCLETSGLPRMAGRILGWLLVCTPPFQTSDQVAEALDASKGTVSTMTRMLIQLGLIEKIGLPGERRDYFRIRPDLWEQMIAQQLTEIAQMRDMAERGLELMKQAPLADRQRLSEMYELYSFFEQELPSLLERYRREKSFSGSRV